MDSTFPQDLLDLKICVDHWRTTRRFIREALPPELRQTITECLSRQPVSLINKALNGLSALSKQMFAEVPSSGALIVFRNYLGMALKLL